MKPDCDPCPRCGGPIDCRVMEGLCPQCLLRGALAPDITASDEADLSQTPRIQPYIPATTPTDDDHLEEPRELE